MDTKIVYVLVSSEKDYYAQQLWLSLISLKKHNPDVWTVIITDTLTEKSLIQRRLEKLFLNINEKIVIDIDKSWSGMLRSRYLKTSVRKYISGDFLFIDTDTIITRPLKDIDCFSCIIGGVLDCHSLLHTNPYKKMILNHAKALSNVLNIDEPYYNSGVLFVKDHPSAHEFYTLWNKYWLEGTKNGVPMDQPSFSKTNRELKIVETIDGEWNCQLKHGLKYFRDSRILHILTTNKSTQDNMQLNYFQNIEVYQNVNINGDINIETVNYINDFQKGFTNNATEIITGPELEFFHSFTGYCFKKLFIQHKRVFIIFNNFLQLIRHCVSFIKKLFRRGKF